MELTTPNKFQELMKIPHNFKTEEAILNRLEELQIELKICQDLEQRIEIQKVIDQNFLTLGMLYHSILYNKEKTNQC